MRSIFKLRKLKNKTKTAFIIKQIPIFAYNKKHGITPKTIEKSIRNILEEFGITHKGQKANGKHKGRGAEVVKLDLLGDSRPREEIIKEKEKQMKQAAKNLEFELAGILRDEVRELKRIKS